MEADWTLGYSLITILKTGGEAMLAIIWEPLKATKIIIGC